MVSPHAHLSSNARMMIGVKRPATARIGRQHREHHREPERREQVFRRAPSKKTTDDEHTADREASRPSSGQRCPRSRAASPPDRTAHGLRSRRRWVFSIVTVESSTRICRPRAPYRRSVMVLSVSTDRSRGSTIDVRNRQAGSRSRRSGSTARSRGTTGSSAR